MKCIKCGAEIEENASFCDHCGAKQEVSSSGVMGDAIGQNTNVVPPIEKKNCNCEGKCNCDKKKIFIIAGVAIVVALIIVACFILFKSTSGEKDEKPENKPSNSNKEEHNYADIMEAYGKQAEEELAAKIASGEDFDPWDFESGKYLDYEISCFDSAIYPDGKIYLEGCTINDSEEEYSYGFNRGMGSSINGSLTFYFVDINGGDVSYEVPFAPHTKETVKCETDTCYLMDYDYFTPRVVIKEKTGKFRIYDYKTKKEIVAFDNGEKVLKVVQDVIIIENANKKQAVYYIPSKKITIDYGEYKFLVFDPMTGNVNTIGNHIVGSKGDENIIANLTNGKTVYKGEDYISLREGFAYLTQYIDEDYNYKMGLFDLKTEKQVLNNKYYNFLAATTHGEGYALVDENGTLKLLNLKGETVEEFIKVPRGYSKEGGFMGYGTFKKETGEFGVYLTYYQNHDGEGCVEYYYDFKNSKFHEDEMDFCGGYAKPVLYLYPTKPALINVTFQYPNMLTTTYPKFIDSWKVFAQPNGDLYDLKGNYYYALYWEENKNHEVDFSEGFYVTKDNAIGFLEEKLNIIGFNARERNEMIMYWLPILEKNGQSLVYFELTEEREYYNKLFINPVPDSLLRVAIHVKKVDRPTEIKEQRLRSFERKGFVAIEWGGVLY